MVDEIIRNKLYNNEKIQIPLQKKSKRRFGKLFKILFYKNWYNKNWVGDLTYTKTQKNVWCYLASVLDLHFKKIVRYSFGKNMTNGLVMIA